MTGRRQRNQIKKVTFVGEYTEKHELALQLVLAQVAKRLAREAVLAEIKSRRGQKQVKERQILNESDYPLVLTVKEMMEILRCGREKMYQYARRSDFPRLTGNRHIKAEREAFFSWLHAMSPQNVSLEE